MSRLLFIVALLALCTSRAAAAGVQLIYERGVGAEDCADEKALRAAVVSELHADPFRTPAEWTMTATVRRTGSHLRARIVLKDPTGETAGTRELSGRDCEELFPAVAWVIALAVSPLMSEEQTSSEPPKATSTPGLVANSVSPAREAPPEPSQTISARATPRPRRFGWRITGGVVAALSDSPAPATLGFTLGGALVRRWYTLGLELRGDLPSGSSAAFGGRVETSRVFALFVPCLHHRIAFVCALAAVGEEHGGGQGYVDASTVTAPLVALGGRIAVEVPVVDMLSVQFHADVLAPLTHLELYLGHVGTGYRLYRTPDVSSALGVSFVAHYP